LSTLLSNYTATVRRSAASKLFPVSAPDDDVTSGTRRACVYAADTRFRRVLHQLLW